MKQNVVLFVDDEENILHSIKRAVVNEDFTAVFANSAAEALLFMEKYEISVLVTDMMMPQMDGLSLLKEVKIRYPMISRMVLSGYTQLSQVLAAVNQGDIFRFITKPWDLETELLPSVWQGIEYYNLRCDKQKLEKSLQQRNTAYRGMLSAMEEKFSKKKGNLDYLKKFLLIIVTDLENQCASRGSGSHCKGLLKLQLIREISNDYFQTIPIIIQGFALHDMVEYLSEYLTANDHNRNYYIKTNSPDIKCFGNYKLLIMILLTTAKIVCRLGGERKFKHFITTQVYQDKGIVRISNVIEFGYVDGAKVIIDKDELLSHANLEFYTALLAQIGQPSGFDVAYTAINQNTSLIAISAEFALG